MWGFSCACLHFLSRLFPVLATFIFLHDHGCLKPMKLLSLSLNTRLVVGFFLRQSPDYVAPVDNGEFVLKKTSEIVAAKNFFERLLQRSGILARQPSCLHYRKTRKQNLNFRYQILFQMVCRASSYVQMSDKNKMLHLCCVVQHLKPMRKNSK